MPRRGVKPFSQWRGRRNGATPETDQISMFVVDWTALRYAFNDTVTETRGFDTGYRVGDAVKMVTGHWFHR